MKIRKDFASVENLLLPLTQYANIFNEFDKDWSHFKNKEDFDKVYKLPSSQRFPLEDIYAEGRSLADFMSSRLLAFNTPSEFSTLKKFLDSFDRSWLSEIEILKNNSLKAKNICENMNTEVPWSVDQMIKLYDKQIDLLPEIKHNIESLKNTDLYKWNNREAQLSFPIPEYTKILEVIHNVGKMLERLPRTYTSKDEEGLRDHILVALQAIITGSATGETFNHRGKTDILIRNNNVNEFIGECKIWRGEESYKGAIDQLLSYLSWRDNNTAIILFVPNKDFSSILNKVDTITEAHPSHFKTKDMRDETWKNFEFKLPQDNNKIINVAVMLYHIDYYEFT